MSNPKFDQVVQGNIDIKKLNKKKYKITFSEIHKFLNYQIWSDSSQQSNENRIVYYQKAKQWIQKFNSLNTSLKASNKPLFNPTTVMKIGNNKFLFVINKAKLNGNGHVVFKVSTKEIKLSDKKMLELPRGHHDGVRFDIDWNLLPNFCGESANSCTCAETLNYQINNNKINCQSYDNCDPTAPDVCYDANEYGCGTKYSWNSTVNIFNLTANNYCSS
jgi:hypothetical protein